MIKGKEYWEQGSWETGYYSCEPCVHTRSMVGKASDGHYSVWDAGHRTEAARMISISHRGSSTEYIHITAGRVDGQQQRQKQKHPGG